MYKRPFPYTGDDLIALGRIVNKMTKRLKAFEADSGSDVEEFVQDLRVEVVYDEFSAGYIGFEDGWLGFFPRPVRDNEEEK